jgi:hypothetical protein
VCLLICALLLQKERFCSLLCSLELVNVAIGSSKARLKPGEFTACDPVLGCSVERLGLQRAVCFCFGEGLPHLMELTRCMLQTQLRLLFFCFAKAQNRGERKRIAH